MSSPPAHRSTLGQLLKFWLPLALFSVLWIDLIRQLSYTWETNDQYAYGWFVPLLALGLLIRRWADRPLPLRLERGESDATLAHPISFSASDGEKVAKPDEVFPGSGEGLGVRVSQEASHAPRLSPFQLSAFNISAFVFLLCLLLLPLRVIAEINQDWPLISWPLTLIVVALTLYAFHLAGPPALGRSPEAPASKPISAFRFLNFRFFHLSPWVRHFAFPVCFILVAVQWPYRIEHSLTQGLMQVVASLTVEIIGWFGIPALQRGNLIELSTGVLGVDEACSGIRSFQSTLMAALFLGELYRLRAPIRLGLVGAGLAAAFLLNVVRTLLLTWQAEKHGLSAIDKWHDPAGFTIAIACFFVLWLIAILIKNKWKTAAPLQPVECATTPLGPLQPSPRELVERPISPGPPFNFQLSTFNFRACRRYLLAVGLWSLACIAATEVWYRSHEAKNTGFVRWSVTMPTTKPAFQILKLPPRTLGLLGYDSGTAAQWQEEDGSKWDVFFFQWHGKSIQSIMASRNHRPEVCLPAAGLKQISESQTDYFEVVDLKLAFRKASYSATDQTVHVFYCIWQDGDERRNGLRDRDREDRLLGPKEGRRRFGQQVLEIITSG